VFSICKVKMSTPNIKTLVIQKENRIADTENLTEHKATSACTPIVNKLDRVKNAYKLSNHVE